MPNISIFMNRDGVPYKIERNGQIVCELDGLTNVDGVAHREIIQFYPGSDVQVGDWMIDPYGLRMFVKEVRTFTMQKTPFSLDAFYITESAYNSSHNSKQNLTYNIGNIHGSAIVGNQQNFTVNQGASMEDLLSLIADKPANDRTLLSEMAIELAKGTELKKGALQKFGAILSKYSDIAIFVGKMLLAFATGGNP